ncbi:hypothetical protein Tco_1402339 [Tanacetum coccineum]
MAGYKHNQLKNKSFDDIQKLFDKAMKRVNIFVDMDTELVEGSEVRAEGGEVRVEGSEIRTEGSYTRAGEDLQQESIKKQKLQALVDYNDHKRKKNNYQNNQVMEVPRYQVGQITQDYRVFDWKLYDSCGVHSLRKQNVHIHMLVEKRYPLTPATITDMLNRKQKDDHWNEMCYQLLKLITKQLKL